MYNCEASGYNTNVGIITLTPHTHVFSTLVPEVMTESTKQEIVNALTSVSGGNPGFAKQTIHNIIERLTVIEDTLRRCGRGKKRRFSS